VPLSDIKVIDCGQVIAGPLCATFLSDFGADVVKIEPPGGEMFRTDRRRLNGEPFNPAFELFNRNKQAVCVDLKSDEGLDVIYDLVTEADVFVQNWPPGVAGRLGVDYDTLQSRNDDLVYVHITGYGQSGPMADAPGMDGMVQHVSGFSSMLGYDDHPPIRSQSSLVDYFAAYNAALSVLGALIQRDRVGGQKVEVSLLESLAHNLDGVYEYYTNLGEVPQRAGQGLFHSPEMLFGAAEAADGWVSVALLLYSERIWRGYCELLDRPDLYADERYSDVDERLSALETFTSAFETWLAEQPVDEAVETLNDHGIPAAPYQTVDEAVEMEQMVHLGVFEELSHPRYGSLTLTKSPISLSKADTGLRRHAPVLGEHNREVLHEFGYDDDEIAALYETGTLTEEQQR